ncbi:MAG: dihydroorotase family protein, partial [Candidatus Bathyarchaeota archaeon]
VIGFKLFTYNPLDGLNPEDLNLLTKVFKILKKEEIPLAIHAESGKVLFETAATMSKKELDNPERYPEMRPPRAETEIVKKVIEVIRKVRNPVHLCHLSTKKSIEMVREAKEMGMPITCEVTPHHLLLTKSQMRRLGSKGMVNPPLRSREDILGLWEGVLDGTVDILASDHAPHERSEKESESVTGVPPGFSGIETLASIMLTQVIMGRMNLDRFVRMTSTAPVEILGLGRRGRLKKDYHADLAIVDPKEEGRIDPSKFESKARHSPFEGYATKGKVTATIVNGQVVMNEGEIVAAKAIGKILRKGQL